MTSGIVNGAIDPATGIYYLGGQSGPVGYVFGFDPATGSWLGEVARIPVTNTNHNNISDYAFDGQGRLYYSTDSTGNNAGRNLLVTNLPIGSLTPGVLASTRTITSSTGAAAAAGSLAFGADGYLYLGAGTSLLKLNPTTGAVVTTTAMTPAAVVGDFASCAKPSTVTLRKDLPQGRGVPSDQFDLTIGVPATAPAVLSGNTGTTTGAETGLQNQVPTETAGPLLVLPSAVVTISESRTTGPLANAYTTTYRCTNELGVEVATGTAATGSFTMPAVVGADVSCVFTNIPVPPSTGTPPFCTALWGVVAGVSTATPAGNQVFSIDPTTGAMTRLVTGGVSATDNGTNVSALAVDPRNGRLFAVDNRTGPNVVRLNSATASWETTGQALPGGGPANAVVSARAVMDGDGNLYVGRGNTGTAALNFTIYRYPVALDGTVGAPTTLTIGGPSNNSWTAGDFVVAPDGTFYFLYSNPATNVTMVRLGDLRTATGTVTPTAAGTATIAGLGTVGGGRAGSTASC